VLALTGSLLAVACTRKTESPVQDVAYFRNHPAEWEQRVWVCTNDPGTLEHTPECATALLALRSGEKPAGDSDLTASGARSPFRR
jgi:hypothetical protein